jgi:transcriptional regulator with XRE-family HTH domain
MPLTKSEKKKLEILGAKVREIRLAKGLTLKELAHKIGKDIQSVQRFEKGNINPSYLYLEEICVGLEIELADVLHGLTK